MHTRRILGFLTLLALLLAPLGMISGHMAMAQAPASKAGASHCAESEMAGHEAPADGTPVQNIDCAIACACISAAGAPAIRPQAAVPGPHATKLELRPAGLNPAAEPPPPRLS